MAGMDLSKVHIAGLYGARIEGGSIAYVTGGTTLSVPTTLQFIYASTGVTTTGKGNATAPVGTVSGSAITFTRTDTTSGDVLQYILFGF